MSRRRERARKRHERQFGPKGRWLRWRHPRCAHTGSLGHAHDPVELAHVLGTRGAGAGSEGLLPLLRSVHRDFDTLGDARFEQRQRTTKDQLRGLARELEHEWQRCVQTHRNWDNIFGVETDDLSH